MTAEADKPNPPPEPIIHTVPASRLAWGRFNHDSNRDEVIGDIHRSYSACEIAEGKPVKTFRHDGNLMVTVSMSGRGSVEQVEAYRLLPLKQFAGTPTTYREKVSIEGGNMARNDPNGFYQGMTVKAKGETFVMVGPEVLFIGEPERPDAAPQPQQMDLFA